MSTLQQVREGLSHAWEVVAEGWQRLYQRAAGALTRYSMRPPEGELESTEGREIAVRSTGWGLLAAEVFDDGDQIVVRLEAPGMDKDDFDLEVLDGHLVVRGSKQIERERTEGQYHITECAYGSFERAIPLPEDVEPDRASARYKRGVLRVELPKTVPASRNRISVKLS